MTFNNPNHYKIDGVDSMEHIIKLTAGAVDADYNEIARIVYIFNAFKYIFRHRKKNGAEDLDKAIDYINRLKDITA